MECAHCKHNNADGAVYCSSCATRLLFANRYVVQSILGTGTFGVVFKCTDSTLKRIVAIKELRRQHHSDETLRKRFHDEAQTLASLQHENIVRIYDTDPNELYIVMEYVSDAKDLARMEEQHPGYCRDHFDELVAQLTAALEFAHSKRVLHKDLKYENILVSGGKFKVSDFGLAAILQDNAGLASAAGTLPYMAPEILSRSAADARADLYSLGVLFYHIWTGHFPFEGTDFEVARGHLERVPPQPTLHNIRVSKELSEIILKLLEKEPSQRFPSAASLREAYHERVGNKEALMITHFGEFQNRLAGIYSEINKKRTSYDILTNIQIRASGLSRYAMAEASQENLRKQVVFLCKLFGWALSMATHQRSIASEALLSKYRNKCPYCTGAECVCPPTGKAKSHGEVTGEIPNYTSFDEIQQMFRRIYGKRNTDLVTAIHKLHIELGELSEAVARSQYAPGRATERQVTDEIADVFAWLFAISNLIPESVSVSRELVSYFDRKCHHCGKAICKCDLERPEPQLL